MLADQLTNGRILHITPGRVNLPVVEDIADNKFIESAIFGTQYKQMLSCLNIYVKYRPAYTDKRVAFVADSPNNVFTFVGERGSGKTSCMSSVSKLLTSGNIHTFYDYDELAKTQFVSIDIIDPSYFDEDHNIVAIMVAKLYKAFTEYDNSNESNKCDRNYRNELIDAFVKTQKSMKCLLDSTNSKNEYESDDIENLSELSVAIDLKDDIYKLVQSYLKFVKKENGILILSIDDIDLNVSEADTMAEQIRKYLVNPNIIILLAAKLDQLATVKNLHFAKKYAPLLESNHMEYDTIEEMTSQFLTKFAPHDQRVYMPTMEVYLNSGIEMGNNNWYGDSVMQVVPELIFNRTRYLFYNSKQTPSYIIPRNLRKLCQLVAMLWSMDEYHNATQDANKVAFKNYLFGSWVQDNLLKDDRKLVNRLIDGWKNEQLNRIALDVLSERYKNWIENKKQEEKSNLDRTDLVEEVKALFDERNREFNLSTGDVLSLIDVLEISFESHADKCFFFIIKSIYSMALYETYDILTEERDNQTLPKYSEQDKIEDRNQVLLYDPFEDEKIEAYHKLVGGRFYNYRLSSVLAKESVTDHRSEFVSRSDRMVNYAAIEQELIDVVELWKNMKNKDIHIYDEQKVMIKQQVRLCEFFMLCCIRDINQRNRKSDLDYYDPRYRQAETVYYNGVFSGKEWLYFDLGAFFFNVTRMDECYKRFKDSGKNFLQLCQQDEDQVSFYSTFRETALSYRKDYSNPHAWLSWASIRNAEIIFDLNQHLRSKCNISDAGNQKHLARYFKVLSKYNIKTYDRDGSGTKFNINFEFASEIFDLLNNDSISDKFNEIFSAFSEKKTGRSQTTISNVLIDSGIPQIDISKLLMYRKSDVNKKETIRDYLVKNEGQDVTEFQYIVDTVLSQYGSKMTRDEIEKAGHSLNEMLSSKYGNIKGNSENTFSQARSQADS